MARLVEIFADVYIDGENTNYMISDDGNVYNKKNKNYLKPRYKKKGYLDIDLTLPHSKKRKVTIHKLVANAFIPNPENKPTVNHKNAKKDDNRVENLEWATYSEQINHAIENDLIPYKCGIDMYNAKYTEDQIHNVCKYLSGTNLKYKEISKLTGVSIDTIKNIKKGKQWKHISKEYDIDFNSNRGHKYSDELKNNIFELIQNGYSNKDIIYILNLDKSNGIYGLIGTIRRNIKEEESSTTIENNDDMYIIDIIL